MLPAEGGLLHHPHPKEVVETRILLGKRIQVAGERKKRGLRKVQKKDQLLY